jgi:hypothetical protein
VDRWLRGQGRVQPEIVGDGLVPPLKSALGRHAQLQHGLVFAPEHQWIACGMNRMDLLSRPEVAQQLVRWLGASG